MSKSVKAEFIYAGHSMGLVFSNMGNGWHVATQSTGYEQIEGGVYPRHFAEGEAIDAITNLTIDDKNLDAGNLESVRNAVTRAIGQLISEGVFTKAGI